ncbi:HAD-IA family hydrolase [Clostridium perfringens]|nr:HAD-IA family hydrolase [Clostridium perfringens]
MLNNIKGVIFDLDGTLVDSMGVWAKIDVDYLNNLGHEVPNNLKEEITHLGFKEVAKYFKKRFNIADSEEEIMKTWHDMAYIEYKENIKLKPGAREFLKQLKESNIKIGLATSNSYPLLEVSLKSNDIFDLFDSITITGEVSRGKNFPDVYLLAAERLGLDPKDCAVFEDILPAVRGALSAGMKVFAVEDHTVSDEERTEIKKYAHEYIESFNDLLIK